jgi:hypothetical protein
MSFMFRHGMQPTERPEPLSRFGLTLLAAVVSVGSERSACDAIAYAYELWAASEKHFIDEEEARKLDSHLKLDILYDSGDRLKRDRDLERWRTSLPKPKVFPARLDDLFDLVIKAKTPADCTKRLRDFFRYRYVKYGQGGWGDSVLWGTMNPDTEAAGWIGILKSGDASGGCFTTERQWTITAGSYTDWWKAEKAQKARLAAGQRRKNATIRK